MNREELRNRQAPLKDRYRDHPESAKARLTAHGKVRIADQSCDVDCARTEGTLAAGLHPMAGGDGTEICSGDLLLQSLVACSGVTLAAVATAMALKIDSAEITACGELDFRGTLGVDREVAVGFESIRLEVTVTGQASAEEVDKLLELTDRYCVVMQTISRATPVCVTRIG